jgi:nicotinate-nucleotide adenylyltransferase
MRKVVSESREGAVNVGGLAAGMAVRAEEGRSAIEAVRFAGSLALAGVGLDRAGGKTAGHRLAQRAYAFAARHGSIMKEPPPHVERHVRGGTGMLAKARMTGTGLFGGSFNPAHRGHRKVSAAAIRALALDELWWLVSPGNPLKDPAAMAPLPARLASATAMARRLPIRTTAIERELGTRYTVDTLSKLVALYPARRFIWIMGEDNLAQFHRWRHWRKIAQTVPIAVVSRPGYDAAAHAARAMGWLRRYVRPAGQASEWTEWTLPALVLLKLPPDPTSSTAIRAAEPDWHLSKPHSFNLRSLRDGVTRRPVT